MKLTTQRYDITNMHREATISKDSLKKEWTFIRTLSCCSFLRTHLTTCCRAARHMGWRLVLLLGAALQPAHTAVVTQLQGANASVLSHCSSGGGSHVYISGTDIGSAFAPPTVLIGTTGQVECKVQPFTTTNNRLHCIIGSVGTPTPTPQYEPEGAFVSLPINVLKGGQRAECWVDCSATFDIGGSARVLRLLTPTVDSGGTFRISGEGIDGGLRGAPKFAASVYRGATPVLGSCGEKDCQASDMGSETLGCYSRPDAGGDGVGGQSQESQVAVAFSDATRFGCQLDAMEGGLTGGFFNLSLHAIADPYHRGDAYLGFLATRKIDLASADPFDAELPPRITSIEPTAGSLAGGTDVTIRGTGQISSAAPTWHTCRQRICGIHVMVRP